jgi:hypothetical protein
MKVARLQECNQGARETVCGARCFSLMGQWAASETHVLSSRSEAAVKRLR